ncbi:uncharacterized protein LOC134787079 [Penaeus indicus]|uniref:uncharacterized protein LOC134787079 n=1 Tax=Penaeus indicus TaxID=29960 RepID=UPI00300C5798
MMEGALTCPVCSHVYERGERDPLVLPCGHTFCRGCLVSLEVDGCFACPSCRASHHSASLDVFPVNFSLLNLTQQSHGRVFMRENSCSSHGEPLNYWCRDCQQLLCGCCILKLHLKDGHDVVHTSDFITEKKKDIKKQAKRLSQVLTESKESVIQKFHLCVMKIVELCGESENILTKDEELQKISSEAKTFNEVESILVSETRLQSLQQARVGEALPTSTGDASRPGRTREYLEVPDGDRSLDEECSQGQYPVLDIQDDKGPSPKHLEPKSAGELGAHEYQLTTSASLPNLLPWPLKCCVVAKDGRQTTMKREDGLVLVGALSLNMYDAHVTVQMAVVESMVHPEYPQVFLELHAGERYLGRLVIRLWGRLRRAQHFKALCLASFGPSYTGSRLEYVGNKNQPGEFIVGGGYLDQDSKRSSRGLMDNLEWGGQFAGEDAEGLLQGAGGGHREYDALFCICSRTDVAGKSQCPFGEVVSGMEVVRAAAQHEPIADVRISRSGIVLPES